MLSPPTLFSLTVPVAETSVMGTFPTHIPPQQWHILLAPTFPAAPSPRVAGQQEDAGAAAPGAEDHVSMKARPESPRHGAGQA